MTIIIVMCCPECDCPEFELEQGKYIVCSECGYDERPKDPPPEKAVPFVAQEDDEAPEDDEDWDDEPGDFDFYEETF